MFQCPNALTCVSFLQSFNFFWRQLQIVFCGYLFFWQQPSCDWCYFHHMHKPFHLQVFWYLGNTWDIFWTTVKLYWKSNNWWSWSLPTFFFKCNENEKPFVTCVWANYWLEKSALVFLVEKSHPFLWFFVNHLCTNATVPLPPLILGAVATRHLPVMAKQVEAVVTEIKFYFIF